MQRRPLGELIAFQPGRMAKHRVFETDRTMTDLYCLDPGQEQLLLVHEASDKVLVVMAGRVLVGVSTDRRLGGSDAEGGRSMGEQEEAAQYDAVLVPAGTKHTLKNLGPDPAVVLVFLGPRTP